MPKVATLRKRDSNASALAERRNEIEIPPPSVLRQYRRSIAFCLLFFRFSNSNVCADGNERVRSHSDILSFFAERTAGLRAATAPYPRQIQQDERRTCPRLICVCVPRGETHDFGGYPSRLAFRRVTEEQMMKRCDSVSARNTQNLTTTIMYEHAE